MHAYSRPLANCVSSACARPARAQRRRGARFRTEQSDTVTAAQPVGHAACRGPVPLQLAGRLRRAGHRAGRRRPCAQQYRAWQAAAPAAGRASSSVRVWLRIFSLRFRCCDCFAGPASFSAGARASTLALARAAARPAACPDGARAAAAERKGLATSDAGAAAAALCRL